MTVVCLAAALSCSAFCCKPTTTIDGPGVADARRNTDLIGDDFPIGDTPSAEQGVPSLDSCTHVANKACWMCGQCPSDHVTYVGCSAPMSCELFCTTCMPVGYSRCSYAGPEQAQAPCKGWTAPKGPLSGCDLSGTWAGLPLYCCYFCTSFAKNVTAAKNSSGECHWFCNSCLPEGYQYTDGC